MMFPKSPFLAKNYFTYLQHQFHVSNFSAQLDTSGKLKIRSVERGICPISKSTIKSYNSSQ